VYDVKGVTVNVMERTGKYSAQVSGR
jgi:hypothetical protein